MHRLNPAEWLDQEEATCREDRLARLEWLTTLMPRLEYLTFPGGLIAKYLFEEARYCFVYGQFVAATVLGMAYVEHTLAALLYAAGRSDLERANISELLREAVDLGWVSTQEFEALDQARRLRNPLTHFRGPGYGDTVEFRSVAQGELPYELLEQDAQHVMRVVFHLLAENAA